MRIVCESCTAEYNLDDSRVPAGGMELKCPKCLHAFRVTHPGEEDAALEAEGTADGRWYVLRRSGKIYGPFEVEAVVRMILDGKLDGSEQVSTDQEAWSPIRGTEPFGTAFTQGSEPPSDMTIPYSAKDHGVAAEADLPAPKGAAVGAELPAPRDAALPAPEAELPAPRRTEAGPVAEVPASGAAAAGEAAEADLPVPAGQAPTSAELPAPAGGADLPAPAGGAALPARAGSGPARAGSAELPAPSAGPGLPAPSAGPGLPGPAPASGTDLPTPAGPVDPFAPPSSAFAHADIEADLPAPAVPSTAGGDIPEVPVGDSANPFAPPGEGIGPPPTPPGGAEPGPFDGMEPLTDAFRADGVEAEGEVTAGVVTHAAEGQKKGLPKPLIVGGALVAVAIVGVGLLYTDLIFPSETPAEKERGKRGRGSGSKEAPKDDALTTPPRVPGAAKPTGAKAPGATAKVGEPAVTAAPVAPKTERPLTDIPVDSYRGYDWAVQQLGRAVAAGQNPSINRALAALARAYQSSRYGMDAGAISEARTLLSLAKDASGSVEHRLASAALRLVDSRHDTAIRDAEAILKDVPNQAEAIFIKGEALRLKGKHAEAEQALLKALAARTGFKRADQSLGELFYATQRPEDAANQFRKVLAVEPTHPAAALGLAQILFEKKDYDEALEALEAPTDERSGYAPAKMRARAHHQKALVEFRQHRGEEAVATLTQCLKNDPKLVACHLSLAEHYDRRGHHGKALSQYETLQQIGKNDAATLIGVIKAEYGMGLLKSAEEHVTEGAGSFPRDPRFPYYRGQLHERREKWKEARGQYSKALLLDSSFLWPTVRLANLLAKEGKWSQAQSVVETSLVANPDSAVLHNGLGTIFFGKKGFERAESEFRRSVELDPDLFDARFNLARVLRDTGRFEEALQEFLAVQGAGVDSVELHFDLAQTYQMIGEARLEQAIEEYNIVLSLDQRTAIYPFKAGTAYFDKGDSDKARIYFLQALQLEPKLHEAHFYIGLTHFQQNNFDDSVKRFQVASDEARDNLKYRFWLAFTFQRQGLIKQSLELYRLLNEEVTRNPHRRDEVPDLFYQQGLIYFTQGKWHQALKYLKQGLGSHEKRADPWFKTAACLSELAKYELALPIYREAVKRDPDYGDAWLGMAKAYVQQKRPELTKATEACHKAINLETGACYCHEQLAYIERDRKKWQVARREFETLLKLCGNTMDEARRYELQGDLEKIKSRTGR